ncbi:CPBP family intramembrane glutamic endopeptidase [Acrocarpospora catenulata]|uniref:CPBP family intramembrane glutamic endopeptidase n=1 Tax=Acrocarpospora catenulata TaxID=2836182 RepID=UPI001BD91B25|nr:CPBP family intramembrane glutamic endopeptidase [Acrocarpospora catenulata]
MGVGRAVAGCCVALGVANVMNNLVAKRWAPVTSAVAAGLVVGIARKQRVGWGEMGFAQAERGALVGGVLAGGVAAAYAAGVAMPQTRGLFRDERALALSRRRLIEEALIQVPVGTVLLEEVAFRGVLPALLGRLVGTRAGAGLSAALFGVWHVLPALDMARANPSLTRLTTAGEAEARGQTGRLVAGTVVSTAAAGLFFHELRRRGGLLAPALVHTATNSFGYAAARIARRVDRRPKR